MSDGWTDADWRDEADERIEAVRKADAEWRLQYSDGNPLTEPVRVRLNRHAFGFGTCIGGRVTGDDADSDRYRRWVRQHCSTVVSENSMKWYTIEAEDGQIDFGPGDAELGFARSNGLRMRGHCLLWAQDRFAMEWLKGLDADTLLKRSCEHSERVLTHFGDRVSCWDALNEMLDGRFFSERLGPEGHAQLLRHMNSVAPEMPLFTNEFSIIDQDPKLEDYLRLIDELRSQGVVLGGIGVQEHAGERFTWGMAGEPVDGRVERQGVNPLVPTEVWRRLDRLAATGLPVHVTEFSINVEDDNERALALEKAYRCLFAHSAVDELLLWGFWAKNHWLGRNAALVGPDWEDLPAMTTLERLLGEEWHTDLVLEPDTDGVVRFRGFKGSYQIQAGPWQGQLTLGSDGAQQSLSLSM